MMLGAKIGLYDMIQSTPLESNKSLLRKHDECMGLSTMLCKFRMHAQSVPALYDPRLLCCHRHGTLEVYVASCLSKVLWEHRHADRAVNCHSCAWKARLTSSTACSDAV